MSDKRKTESDSKKSWYNDRYQFVVVQRNILALITLLSLICSIAATFSISQLAPLKSVEPFVIQVDQKSGVTQVVDPLKAHELTANQAVNQYFIVQYVRARETFAGSIERNNYNANLVRVFSTPNIYNKYQHDININNPESPAARLVLGGIREVRIGSVSYLDKQDLPGGEESRRYQVRAQILESGSQTGTTGVKMMQKLITIEFKYTELELTAEDRYLNPIGFRVLSYRVDDDNLTQ